MKFINVDRFESMIQYSIDINELISIGLSNEEICGYIIFFAENIINPLSTVIGSNDENNRRDIK